MEAQADMQGDSSKDLQQLWGPGAVRVFISHTSSHKLVATRIQDNLKRYNVASFVSHEDIKPMTEWEAEIRRALHSAHALVALLTDDFSQSDWTDQEVGIAIGCNIPVIPVRLGRDPYGFIAKYQAISGSILDWSGVDRISDDVFGALLEIDAIGESIKDIYVTAVHHSPCWNTSNALAQHLPKIRSLSPAQVQTILDAFNTNPEVSGSFGFKGSRRHGFQADVAEHLSRITGQQYIIASSPEEGLTLGLARELDALWPFGMPVQLAYRPG